MEAARVWRRDVRPARSEAVIGPEENEPGSTSALADRREPAQVLERGRADRLERSRHSVALAKAVRARVEIGAQSAAVNGLGSTSGLAGRREPGSGFGARPSRPFGAKPGFGGGREGGAGQTGERGGERPRFDKKEWKPRGQDFGAKPGERPAGRFENTPRKPFRAQGAFVRPAFARPEGSFKRSDGPKKPFEGGRGAAPGAEKSFGRRTGSKARWVPRPGRAGSEDGRARTDGGERPAPAFGGERSKSFGGGARSAAPGRRENKAGVRRTPRRF